MFLDHQASHLGLDDLATGAHEIRLVRYPAGFVNPRHTHPCGHGLFVLEGTLVTHKGSFPPGTFVRFPEGEVMEHCATAESDVTVLFITSKRVRIDYVDQGLSVIEDGVGPVKLTDPASRAGL